MNVGGYNDGQCHHRGHIETSSDVCSGPAIFSFLCYSPSGKIGQLEVRPAWIKVLLIKVISRTFGHHSFISDRTETIMWKILDSDFNNQVFYALTMLSLSLQYLLVPMKIIKS